MRTAPACHVEGREHIPAAGPFLVVLNHYNSPRVGVWWSALAISALLPGAPHWVMTAAWRYPDWFRRTTLEPLTAWTFEQVARVYGFTIMPTMPPRPEELAQRAAAIRKVIGYARSHPGAIVGLAPEGHNSPGFQLGWPPPGSGRFMLGLAERLGRILPAGVALEGGRLAVRFGPPFCPQLQPSTSREQADHLVACQVMEHIAPLVPAALRGEFAPR